MISETLETGYLSHPILMGKYQFLLLSSAQNTTVQHPKETRKMTADERAKQDLD
jgi:hypothetical protein